MTRLLTLISACAVVGALAACGPKVVVDSTGGTSGPDGTGGIASSGGTAGSNGTGMNGVGGGSCFNPPDPATLTFCGGSGTGGGGGPASCENDFCDMHGNTWAAVCSGSTCQCKFNDDVVCTCALNEPGDICAGTPACCPLPTP